MNFVYTPDYAGSMSPTELQVREYKAVIVVTEILYEVLTCLVAVDQVVNAASDAIGEFWTIFIGPTALLPLTALPP